MQKISTEKIHEKFILNYTLLATCARNYRLFAVIMMVVWLILNTVIKNLPQLLKGFKKLVNFQSFVLIMHKTKSVEWLVVLGDIITVIIMIYPTIITIVKDGK